MLILLIFINNVNFAYSEEIEAPIPKKILIIHSNEEFIPANLHLNPELFNVLKKNEEFAITLYSEYLDVARLLNDDIENAYADIFNERYNVIKPDVIISIDFKSFTFLKEKAPQFFNSTPIVLCMLPEGLIDESNLPSNITGNYLSIDAVGSANIIMAMHPNTKEIVIVSGSGAADKSKLIEIMKSLRSFTYDVEIKVLPEMPFEETLDAISKLPSSSVILYNAIFQDSNGEVWIPSEALIEMNKHASVPIYGLYFTNLVNGLVGGSLFEFKEVANDAANKALKILQGTNPSELRLSKVTNKSYFNWKLLERWSIPEKNIPEDSTLLYKEYTTWELYKYQIIGVFVFIVLETILIFLLMMQLRLRRSAEEKLKLFNTELEELVEERTATIHSINETLQVKNSELIEEIKVRKEIENKLIDNVARLNSAQSRLVLAEKHSAINQLVQNLFHRINTPLGNTFTYLELIESKFKQEIEKDDHINKLLDGLKRSNDNILLTMSILNSMLDIQSDELPVEIDLENFVQLLLHDLFPKELVKKPSVIAICYPKEKITLQRNSFRKILMSLADFAKYQRSQNSDFGIAELIFHLKNDSLQLIYKDKALEQIKEISKTFDPFSYNSFKSNESGLELVVLYNSVTIGMNGSIKLVEHVNDEYKRTIEIILPLIRNDTFNT